MMGFPQRSSRLLLLFRCAPAGVSVVMAGGLREPHLERDESKPGLLEQIIAPLP